MTRVLNSHSFRDMLLLSDVAGLAPVLGDRDAPSIAPCDRTPNEPDGTIGAFLQDTASQRRQDSLLFVHAFLAATATATLGPSAHGGGVSEQSTASGLDVLDGSVPGGVAAGKTPMFSGPVGVVRQGLVPDGVSSGQTFSTQDGTRIVQFEVTVPESRKEGETMTFALPDGRSEATLVPAGPARRRETSFLLCFLCPFFSPVVAPECKKVGNEIEHNASDSNLSKVTMSD